MASGCNPKRFFILIQDTTDTTDTEAPDLTLSLIGGGRVACGLARWLKARNEITIGDILTRQQASAEQAVATIGAGRVVTRMDQLAATDLLMIAVPDSSVPGIAEQLSHAGRDLGKTVVFHTSGLHGPEVLDSLTARTAGEAAVHPLRAFNRTETHPDELDGMLCLASGDENALDILRPLFHQARWRQTGTINRNEYHTAAVLLSNYSRTLALSGERILQRSGLDHDTAREIRDCLLGNTLADIEGNGAMEGLTGPLQRGDVSAVARHLQTLASAPDDQALYCQLALLTLRELRTSSRLPLDVSGELEKLLNQGSELNG